MRYVSVFSGIEAASVAWMPLGWEPVAFCESAAFPASVLVHRLPGVPNFGDVREVAWRELRGVADVVVGGSPCQSFSVAGRREGLGGESGLMWEYVRCVRGVRPRWLVWENVPGVLSCARGEDFRRLLSALAKLGYGLAWRVLDAQYFGVPQRRRRVYLVGRLGDPESPAKVLLEPSCMQGNPAKGEGVGEADSRGTGGGPGDGVEVVAFAANQRGELRLDGGDGRTVGAINSQRGGKQAQGIWCRAGEHRGAESALDVSPTVLAGHHPLVALEPPRWLTPVECERLQGLPDDWTRVPWRGKPAEECPDTHRYRAIGNSMCVNVMRWIGRRMRECEEMAGVEATMLFGTPHAHSNPLEPARTDRAIGS